MSDTPSLYKCPNDDCGWIGREEEMHADCAGEMWSNWICPRCGTWYRLEDYKAAETMARRG